MAKSVWRCTLVLLALPFDVHAEEALIAVATNFAGVARHIETEFEATSDHRVTLVTGSTGKLFAQIVNGAPFDVLLAADQERPRLLEEAGQAVTGSRFTFAIGRLALASADASMIGSSLSDTLSQDGLGKLAIANPELAPYGLASKKTLQALGLWTGAVKHVVLGENIGQAYALVATRNAALGFVALSQVIGRQRSEVLTYIVIPERLHDPIRQDAVLQVLVSGRGYNSDGRSTN